MSWSVVEQEPRSNRRHPFIAATAPSRRTESVASRPAVGRGRAPGRWRQPTRPRNRSRAEVGSGGGPAGRDATGGRSIPSDRPRSMARRGRPQRPRAVVRRERPLVRERVRSGGREAKRRLTGVTRAWRSSAWQPGRVEDQLSSPAGRYTTPSASAGQAYGYVVRSPHATPHQADRRRAPQARECGRLHAEIGRASSPALIPTRTRAPTRDPKHPVLREEANYAGDNGLRRRRDPLAGEGRAELVASPTSTARVADTPRPWVGQGRSIPRRRHSLHWHYGDEPRSSGLRRRRARHRVDPQHKVSATSVEPARLRGEYDRPTQATLQGNRAAGARDGMAAKPAWTRKIRCHAHVGGGFG